jgi:hypothetical protein
MKLLSLHGRPKTSLGCLLLFAFGLLARRGDGAPQIQDSVDAVALAPTATRAAASYSWPRQEKSYTSLAQRLPPPSGFSRLPVPAGSYGFWLRHLPVLPQGSPVRSFRGAIILPGNHPALAAVIDLDLSPYDRQQCADTIIRLRGEYLFSLGAHDRARFLWAGGLRFGYGQWRQGLRPSQQGKKWVLSPKARPSEGKKSFRTFLEYIFSWTGTIQLMGEPHPKSAEVQIGDFFIQGGSPGHAVIILDLARSPDGVIKALVGQGYMPAQNLHVLRSASGDPWFSLDLAHQPLQTPFWGPFDQANLRRFANF